MTRCLGYDVYKNNINLVILNKVEVFKQYGKSVMHSDIFTFFKSVEKTFRSLR